MGHLTHLAHFDAPVEVVLRRSIDPRLMSSYMPNITRVWNVHGAQDVPGDSFRFRDHSLGRDLDATSEVTLVGEPAVYETLSTYDNGTRVRWRMTMTPGADGTDVLNEIDWAVPHGLMWRIADLILMRRMLLHTLNGCDRRFGEILRSEVGAAH